MVRENVNACVEVQVENELAGPLSVLEVGHLHHLRHQARRGLSVVARWCRASRAVSFASWVVTLALALPVLLIQKLFAVQGVRAGPRTPIAPELDALGGFVCCCASWRSGPPPPRRAHLCPRRPFQHRTTMATIRNLQLCKPCRMVTGGHEPVAGSRLGGGGKSTRGGGPGTGDAIIDTASGGLVPSGPLMQSPMARGWAVVGWAHLLHVLAPERQKPPHAGSGPGWLHPPGCSRDAWWSDALAAPVVSVSARREDGTRWRRPRIIEIRRRHARLSVNHGVATAMAPGGSPEPSQQFLGLLDLSSLPRGMIPVARAENNANPHLNPNANGATWESDTHLSKIQSVETFTGQATWLQTTHETRGTFHEGSTRERLMTFAATPRPKTTKLSRADDILSNSTEVLSRSLSTNRTPRTILFSVKKKHAIKLRAWSRANNHHDHATTRTGPR